LVLATRYSEQHFTPRRRDRAENGPAGRGFAAAGFADQAERLARHEIKTDLVGRLDHSNLLSKEPFPVDRVVFAEVTDGK
jgi:hypothetical protein